MTQSAPARELVLERPRDDRDPVTGLATRAAWEPALEAEAVRAARSRLPLCVAMVDLDNLKTVNEEQGRLAGDSLLRRAVDAWLRAIRSTDALVRLSAHTFGVVLPDCTPCTADRVLSRMLEAMPDGQSFSAGVALWCPGEATAELLQHACDALNSARAPGHAPVQVAGMAELLEPEPDAPVGGHRRRHGD